MTRGKDTKRRPWPPKKADLEALIEEATVDAYGELEERTGFYTMIEEHLGVPFEAEILGVAVTVERIDMTDDEQIKHGSTRASATNCHTPMFRWRASSA